MGTLYDILVSKYGKEALEEQFKRAVETSSAIEQEESNE